MPCEERAANSVRSRLTEQELGQRIASSLLW
jgi:hypothetical protein